MTDNGSIVAEKHGVSRSHHWPTAQKHFLHANPACAASGITTCVQVHHIAPFHFCILLGRPDLELDNRNFIGLSESEKCAPETNYHLLIGHAGDFQSSNIPVRDDVLKWFGKTTQQIEDDDEFNQRVAARCKPWSEWTNVERIDFRQWLDEVYPLPPGITPEQQVDNIICGFRKDI